MTKAKILCTIGPVSFDVATLKRMHKAGMNGVRVNTAYGTLSDYELVIENVREVADIPIVVDLKGPEIRLRAQHRFAVTEGDIISVGFEDEPITFNHNFFDEIDVRDRIYIDNGTIRTEVLEKNNGVLRLQATSQGEIDNGKSVNIPTKTLTVPTLTSRDQEILEFIKDYDVEYLALSFTRDRRDIEILKSQAPRFKGGIIAKIENSQGLHHFQDILDAVDGILIARGDLGIEIHLERVPLAQKMMITSCNQKGKVVITATEMLESMIHSEMPTRAEVSDVANAILDGTDAMMLSGETAIGEYPIETVVMMERIARNTEAAAKTSIGNGEFVNISDTVSKSIHKICSDMPIRKVVTLTRSGYTARMISRFRIQQPIFAVTPYSRVKRQLELVYGVYPIQLDYLAEDDRIRAVAQTLHAAGHINNEDTVLFTAAFRTVKEHASNIIEIHNIGELMDYNNRHK